MRASSLYAFALFLTACGPDIGPADEPLEHFEERCESFERTQLLTLADDEMVPFSSAAVVPYKGSWLVTVATLEGAYDGSVLADVHAASTRIVSVDDCDRRAPQLFDEGIDRIIPPAREGLPWLACATLTDEMFVIDPEGERPRESLGTIPLCLGRVSDDAIWMERSTGPDTMELIRVSGDGEPQIMLPDLLPDIGNITLGQEYLWAVTGQGELVELHLQTGATEIIATGVEAVVASDIDRFIAWVTDLNIVRGRWTIVDRQTGASFPVEVAGQAVTTFRVARFSFIFDDFDLDFDLPEEGEEPKEYTTTIIEVPSFETRSFPGLYNDHQEVGSGDVIVTGAQSGERGLYVLRVGATAPELLYALNSNTFDADDDDVWVWDFGEDWPLPPGEVATGRLLHFSETMGEPTVIVDGVYQPLGLDDGRWLSVRDYGLGNHGELRMFDPHAGTEQVIDSDVSLFFARHQPSSVYSMASRVIPSDAPFLYTVRDDSQRNGLWRAALAPRE